MASAGQIAEAQDAAFDSGSGDVIGELIKKGFVDYEDMLSMLAQQYGMEMMYLDDYDIPFEVIDSLKSDYARYYQVVPVYKEDSMLTVAMADPTDVEKLDTLRYLLGGNVDAVIAPEKQIQEALDRYYPENEEDTGSVTKDVNMDAADMAIESADAEVGGMEEDDEAHAQHEEAPEPVGGVARDVDGQREERREDRPCRTSNQKESVREFPARPPR